MKNKTSKKSRTVALLLCGFLGTIGAHYFYVGRTGRGILMLILTITIIGLIVTSILSFIDFIYIIVGKFQDDKERLVEKW